MKRIHKRSIERSAIVDRGEAAVRLIRAIRELNGEQHPAALAAVALFTEPDRQAMFVREADDAVAANSSNLI